MWPRSRDALRPSFARNFLALQSRGRREDRVRAAPAVSCAVCTKKGAHEHTGPAENTRPSLRNGFTAYNELSPENGSFASVAPWEVECPQVHRRQRRDVRTTRLCRTPLSRSSSQHRRPPHPRPTFVTIASAPLVGTGWPRYATDFLSVKAKYFLFRGLTRLL